MTLTATATGARPRRAALGLAAALVALLAALAGAPAAHAAIEPDAFSVTTSDPRAGAFADVTTTFEVRRVPSGLPAPNHPDALTGTLRNVRLQMPVGLVGNPTSYPYCPRARLTTFSCPADTQIGEGEFLLRMSPFTVLPDRLEPGKVFNLDPGPDEAALFGISLSGVNVLLYLRISVRPDDYGLDATIDGTPLLMPVIRSELTLWGVPGRHTGAPERPFMQNPGRCDVAPQSRLQIDAYEAPGEYGSATATAPMPTSCATVPFDPRVSIQADSVVDAPSRVQVDIAVPQSQDPDGQATAHLRDAIVTMPEGLSINPAMAAGLTACTDAQFGRGQRSMPSCPGESAIGTTGIDVPLLRDRLAGRIYVAEPRPGNPFRIFVHAYGSGVHVKLAGTIATDPKTGRMTAIFEGNPEQPFSRLSLTFRGGPLAPIATPATCGVKPLSASFTSWAGGPAVGSTSAITVMGAGANPDCATPAPFAPGFSAGTVAAGAGADAGLVVAFSRRDGERALGGLRMSMPPGLLGRLTAVPLCSAADGAAGTCSQASLVGDTEVSVGAGGSPLTLRGDVHLTEPFEPGDVAGLSIDVPAKVGPYDLGTVVVRSRITMRPDVGLDVVSDPLPTIVQGIPLRIRRVVIALGRPGFTFNPSDCSPRTITGAVLSADGGESGVASPFQVSGCADLPFAPTMTLAASRPGADRTTGLRVAVGQARGEARMRRLTLTLPPGLGARLDGPLQTPCSEDDFEHDRCAPSALVGSARAVTDAVPYALEAPVYFVANPGGALPRLGVRLRGGPIRVDLLGEVAISPSGRIVTVFDGIPDVPISSFELALAEGAQAVLSRSERCPVASADLEVLAHSGAVSRQVVPLAVDGCDERSAASAAKAGKGKKGKKARKAGKRRKAGRGA